MSTPAIVEFCGERFPVGDDRPLTLGRDADVVIDDNPYLHRVFLSVYRAEGLVWLANVGGLISATVADDHGLAQTWLAPGARIPLVMRRTNVMFSAGPTTYDLSIEVSEPAYEVISSPVAGQPGDTTVGRVAFTPSQRLLIVSLSEPLLRAGWGAKGQVPSSREAANRLGWTMSTFNRKLDNVCEKLSRLGVRGLVGQAGLNASHRKVRLVEYAVSTRLVTNEDLVILDRH